MTSYFPPNCGYSFLSVLKQCGHAVTIFFTSYLFSVSTFAVAIAWNRYSFPILRAGSPVHFSSGPRIANGMWAFWRIRANARVTFRFRSSKEPAQPTHNRYRYRPPSEGAVETLPGGPWFSPATIAGPCSSRVSRMFVMIRIGSSGFPVAFAGQLAVHRPHSVHAYPSRSCRHGSCSTRFTPNVVADSRSTFFSAPFGVRSMKNVFTIAKRMCMCFECGTYARNVNSSRTWVHQNACHQNAGSERTTETFTRAAEIGFHAGRSAVPWAMSAALYRRRDVTIPRMKHRTIVASSIPSCISFFGRIT